MYNCTALLKVELTLKCNNIELNVASNNKTFRFKHSTKQQLLHTAQKYISLFWFAAANHMHWLQSLEPFVWFRRTSSLHKQYSSAPAAAQPTNNRTDTLRKYLQTTPLSNICKCFLTDGVLIVAYYVLHGRGIKHSWLKLARLKNRSHNVSWLNRA